MSGFPLSKILSSFHLFQGIVTIDSIVVETEVDDPPFEGLWFRRGKVPISIVILEIPQAFSHNYLTTCPKLQALVYDILPSTTAVFSYAIGSRKLSANEQLLFFGAQTVVSLLHTTQINEGVSFIAANSLHKHK